MQDRAYQKLQWRASEIEHRYGDDVHIVSDPLQHAKLARLSAKTTVQPEINRLIGGLYRYLIGVVLNGELPRTGVRIPTRMIESTPRAVIQGEAIDTNTRVVTVNIARAGTLPSQVTLDILNDVIDPELVRQDHMIMSRTVDAEGCVDGVSVAGSKIGGDIDGAIVIFPDPMGATGLSLSTALRIFKEEVPGTPRRMVAANLIVTPEYLRRLSDEHPDVAVYAMRLDRGMSPLEVLDSIPGERWDEERGLDERQYIVPGAGGLGELMNNAYV